MFLFQALHQERKALTLSDARRALTFESKYERSYVVNGAVNEKKGSERLNMSKSDVPNTETKDLSYLMSPQKPVIIVHQACIDEKQEECPQTATNSKNDNLTLEEFSDCSLECKDFNKENIHIDANKKEQIVKKTDKSQLIENEESEREKLKSDSKMQNKDNSSFMKNEFPRSTNLSSSCVDDEDTSCKQENDLIIKRTADLCDEMDSVCCDKTPDMSKSKEQNLVKNSAVTVVTKGKDIINSKIRDTGNKVPEIKEIETKLHENTEAQQSCTEGMQGKSPPQKPGPTVYMNKVS